MGEYASAIRHSHCECSAHQNQKQLYEQGFAMSERHVQDKDLVQTKYKVICPLKVVVLEDHSEATRECIEGTILLVMGLCLYTQMCWDEGKDYMCNWYTSSTPMLRVCEQGEDQMWSGAASAPCVTPARQG